MTFLPIVERELRIAARLPATYRNRAIVAGLVILAALVMLVLGIFARSPSQAGASMFRTLSFLALIFCVLEGVRKTADCLSEEKREGTLGLLFLTDLKGYDVVLGKLAGASLNSIYGLIAILPVLALPMLVGGVTQAEYWRMVLALANVLFFSLCAGMLVSTLSRQEGRALVATLVLVLTFMLVPGYLRMPAIAPLSPAHAFSRAFAANYFPTARAYWQSIGIAQALGWLMLGVASVMLPRWWQDKTVEKIRIAPARQRPARHPGNGYQRTQTRREMLAVNPALWLASRHSGARVFLWILTAVAAIGGSICVFSPEFVSLLVLFGILNFVLKVRLAYQACHCFAEARRNNALEMLLATPLTVSEIIQGQILALQRAFLGPVIAIICIEALAIFAKIAADSGADGFAPGTFTMILGSMYLVLFLLDIVAVAWAGMWFGLSAKKETQAITRTILLVLILPYASLAFCWFGMVFFVGIPIFWIGWCSSKLRTEFRNIAAQRYAPPKTVGSAVINPSAPPVVSYPTQ